MTGKIYYKILSVVASVSLLLNSLWGIFLYPQTVFANGPSADIAFSGLDGLLVGTEGVFTIKVSNVGGISDSTLIRYKSTANWNGSPLVGQEVFYPDLGVGDDPNDRSTWSSFTTDSGGQAYFGPGSGFTLTHLPELKTSGGIETPFAVTLAEGHYSLRIEIVQVSDGTALVQETVEFDVPVHQKYINFTSPVTGVYGGSTTILDLAVEAEYDPHGVERVRYRYAPPGETCYQQYIPDYPHDLGDGINEEGTNIYTQTWDISGLASGEYTICALMHKNGGSEGYVDENHAEVSIIIDNDTPSIPTGLHIIQNEQNLGCGGYVNERTITIDWDDNEESDFSHYDYQIREEVTTQHPIVSELTGNIRDEDGYYKYRVRAVDTVGNASEWTNWCGVTLDRQTPPTPELLFPEDQAIINSNNLYVDWSDVVDPNGPVKYEYRLFLTDPNGNPNVPTHYGKDYHEPTTRHPSSGFASGTAEKTYWWRVRACDQAGNCSEWADAWQLTVDNTPPVTSEPLELPEDGSFWNTLIQIKGTSTDNVLTDFINLFYTQSDSSDPWTFIADMTNSEEDAVFDWGPYPWVPDTEGTYDIMAAAVDAAGNEEKSVYVYNVTFDNTQPTIINVSADKDYVKAGDKLTITAEVTDASGINAVSADFSYNIGYTDRPQPTSVAMQNVGGNMYKTIYTVPSGWDEGIMYIKVAARDGTGGNWIRSNDKDTVIVDNTAPLIIFEIPENGSTHAGAISLRAVCDENCDYVNFWWRAESEPYSPSSKRYHYVHDNGTVFEWDLNSLSAKKWDGNTYVMNDGTYYLYAAGKDLVGNWARTPNVQIVVDNTAPLVTIVSPSDFNLLRGTVNVLGTLIEDVELSHYNFSIYPGGADFNDFSLRLYSDTQYLSTGFVNQLLYEWNTTTWSNGDYLLRFAARDKASNRDLSGDPYLGGDDSQHVIRVTVDNESPSIAWTNPAEGTAISGTTILSSVASDSFSGIKSVAYYYQKDDGIDTWHEIVVLPSFPYETSWDTTGLALGDYNLKAVAIDNAGNDAEAIRHVGVAAVISSESWSRPGWGEITITWTTDRPTDGRVVYDTVSHSIDLNHPNYGYAHTSGTVDTAPKTLSHTITLSGLTNSETYYWRTVSGGSPKVISAERRGDTFSIPGGDTGGGGVVAGVVTSATTTPFPYAELEETSTPEEDSEEVLGEETEVSTEEPEAPLDEAVGILSRTTKGRILAISAFLLGLILYFISRRRRY